MAIQDAEGKGPESSSGVQAARASKGALQTALDRCSPVPCLVAYICISLLCSKVTKLDARDQVHG